MPYINVRIADKKSQETASAVATLLTNLAHTELKKNREVAAVDVQFAEYWFVGGKNIDKKTFYIEIKVTAGTNTRDEKAKFIQQAYEGMKNILGGVTSTSYIVVKDVAPDDWGFGGKTQGYRYIKA
ncbi:tautomerase family protein [Companilactobacillus nantensis]|uniref:4-oxalocrotonate tautomerase-like domain-containing protein n=1 Tax=Companilactobacillus nantensis DSM 16982 TaxID=1423774 RepID=A0A0R1WR34_9LACO|nr:tautomerase family protein [Companilactobacillus nantensis]KRM17606.1 hypothetical protein FD31_GL002591 [Companilactobacillus nantensis DSM 16982]GEO64751.1 4-oxalocrotonate tautomerase [Companilactobacillus nantensis]